MGKFIVLFLILLVCAILWCLPLWIIVNFVCLVFHLSFYLSILQAFALCLLASAIRALIFSKRRDK